MQQEITLKAYIALIQPFLKEMIYTYSKQPSSYWKEYTATATFLSRYNLIDLVHIKNLDILQQHIPHSEGELLSALWF